MVMPLGSAPVSLQTIVPLPPVCVNCWSNATPAVPVDTPGLVTVMTLQAMTRVYVAPVPVQPLPSVTVTTMGNEPDCVGVPARRPAVESVSPVGSVEAVVNVAPPIAPVCEKAWLNCEPTVPELVTGFVTVMVWQLMASV